MRDRRGFLLMEMMGALVLMVALSYLTAILFHSLMLTISETNQVQRVDPQRREVIERIRTDVNSALEVRVVGGDGIVLRLPQERSIFWQLDMANESLERRELIGLNEISRQEWLTESGSLPEAFENRLPGMRVIWKRGTPDDGVVDMYSQLLIIERVRR